MKLNQALLWKVVPDVHKVAPGLNSSFVHQAMHRAIHGVATLPSAAAAAEKQLAEQEGDAEQAIRELIENHASLAAAEGFVTNIGGLVTMAATIPLNIAGLALLQARLVAGIAHLRGYDLDDKRVHNAVLLCMLGKDAVEDLVKEKKVPGAPMVLATAPAYDPELDTLIAAEVTSALVGRVLGKRAAVTVVRRVPGISAVWGSSVDAWSTWKVGRYAARELRPRAQAEVLAGKARRRLR